MVMVVPGAQLAGTPRKHPAQPFVPAGGTGGGGKGEPARRGGETQPYATLQSLDLLPSGTPGNPCTAVDVSEPGANL